MAEGLKKPKRKFPKKQFDKKSFPNKEEVKKPEKETQPTIKTIEQPVIFTQAP